MTISTGQRVETADGAGYVFAIEHDWAAVVLDKHSGRNNAPIYWAKLSELEQVEAPAQPLEFQAKWDYVELHNLHTVTPRRGAVVTLEDATGQAWSGGSLQEAIDAHRQASND